MTYLLSLFWFLRQIKSALFWFYLWQLKEYHLGRFIDHFRTAKGKKLLLNKLLGLKVVLLFSLIYSGSSFFSSLISFLVAALYFFEAGKFSYDIFKKKLKKPVFTKKIIFLLLIAVSFTLFYFFIYFRKKNFIIFYLLFFDVLTPVLISGIVLLFQPLAVLLRNLIIIEKAKKKREKFKDLLAIGITGSYGKSSTKEFLAQILSQKFKVLKTKKNQNSEVGISKAILKDLNESHQIFIAEMGAYNRGGIKLLSGIVKPRIGILTGINEQHLATFGSKENIIRTKYELIEALPETGTAILNLDNRTIRILREKVKKFNPKINKIRFCSTKEKADFWVEDIRVEKEELSFRVFSRDGDQSFFRTNLLGAHNIENVLLAVACAKELGMSLLEISRACNGISQSMGSKIKKGVNTADVLDSTYSANPRGVIAHLEYLKLWGGRKVIIMPCLIELGEASKMIHREIGEKIGRICDMAIVTKKECFLEIRESALKTKIKRENILFMEDPREIQKKIKSFIGPGDVILLEGRISNDIKELIIENGI